jgi:NADPH:quinone reductase-like Zn-dependent oxidoreductase
MVTVDQLPTTMRAIRQRGYGDAGMWSLGEEPVPAPGPGRVLVRVEAAAVDQGTVHLLTGEPYLLRLVFGLRAPKRVVPGLDLAGRVVAVGEGVARIRVGDEVFGIGEGSFAEYATALESKLERRPDCWTPTDAAAVPVSGLTAWQALHTAAAVTAGQRVLVIGASGGVGSFAVQIAAAAGAEVTAVCSAAKADFVRGLGAERVIDYRVEDVADLGVAYDIVLDISGRSTLRRLRGLTVPGGVVVLVGGDDKNRVFGPFGRSLRALAWTPVAGRKFVMLVAKEHYSDLTELAGLGAAGRLTPAVDEVYPLAEAAAAITALAAGEVRGKVVLSVGPGTMSA